MNNKRGSEKYYILMSLILGLLVLAISLYFIFNEYFNQDELNNEVCRQSVVLRAAAINDNNGLKSDTQNNLAEEFSFTCKTEVITIDYKDKNKALKQIADSMASCFYLYGEGEYPLYARNWYYRETACFVCSRIHFSEKVIDYYGNLNIGEYLLKANMKNGQTYFNYLFMTHHEKNLNSDELAEREKIERSVVMATSNFDLKKGDILISYQYDKTRSIVDSDWYARVRYGQIGFASGKQATTFLENCAVIETVPA